MKELIDNCLRCKGKGYNWEYDEHKTDKFNTRYMDLGI
jgi:hypothetical protein